MSELTPEQWAIGLLVGPAIGAALTAGLMTFYHNRQKLRLDKELQAHIAELNLRKAAFDTTFKDEVEVYKTLWPLISGLASSIEFNLDPLFQRETPDRAVDELDSLIRPAAEIVANNGPFLPPEFRAAAHEFVQIGVQHRNALAYPALAKAPFKPPPPIEEVKQRAADLQDMITRHTKPAGGAGWR